MSESEDFIYTMFPLPRSKHWWQLNYLLH